MLSLQYDLKIIDLFIKPSLEGNYLFHQQIKLHLSGT